jgi:hypothetical protein
MPQCCGICVLTLCKLVDDCQLFEGTYCFHLEGTSEYGGSMFHRNVATLLPTYVCPILIGLWCMAHSPEDRSTYVNDGDDDDDDDDWLSFQSDP